MKAFVRETAEHVLATMPKPRNPFGSDGGLEHSLEMVQKFPTEQNVRSLASALARVWRQRQPGGQCVDDRPFVWDAKECTHSIDWGVFESMCAELVR